MKPANIMLFLMAVFILLALVMKIVPSDGLRIGGFVFQMPLAKELFAIREKHPAVPLIVEQQFNIDSLNLFTSEANNHVAEGRLQTASYDSMINTINRIVLNDSSRAMLYSFFRKLETDPSNRIMHYGDSQIEGDRITAFVRNRLQSKFGGYGPGLRPAYQPYELAFSAFQQNSPNWLRFTTDKDSDLVVMHHRFGAMTAFSRFSPPVPDTVEFVKGSLFTAQLGIAKTNVAFKRVRRYEQLRMFYGNAHAPVYIKLLLGNQLFLKDTLQFGVDYAVSLYDLPDTTDEISIHFEGYDSPDIYGIELASTNGLIMDNIPLRGSSGLIFTKNDINHSLKMFQDLNPGLFILQFGGNVVPYITGEKAIENYGEKFRQEILRLQKICPQAAIIVIGPSDMSVKVRDRYVTYEHLPKVVEVLKEVSLSTGAGFWNMYEAMGGKNSMPAWVKATPELARPDYVHFSARGARLIANMFYNALILEYNNYAEQRKNQNQQL